MKKLLFSLAMLPCIAFAGGFQLNVQGIKANGMGGAYTGLGMDASSVYFNPGALYQIDKQQLIFGMNYITPSVSLQTEFSDNINQTTPDATPIQAYYAVRVKEKWTFGFAVNNQFGSTSSFADDWEGRYIVQNISLKTFMFQPTINYQVNDWLGLGVGYLRTYGNFSTQKAIPLSTADNLYGQATLEGRGNAYGFNAGIHAMPINKTIGEDNTLKIGIGVNYRSRLKTNIYNGTAEFTGIPSALQNQFPNETNFDVSITLPDVTTAGISISYGNVESLITTFVYDFNYTGWSVYDTLTIDFDNEETPQSVSPKEWKNSITHRVGLDVTYKNKYSIRGGIYSDQSPSQPGFISPEAPEADQIVYTGGLSYKINDKIEIDFSFIRQNLSIENTSLDQANFTANYNRKVNIYGIGLNINFNNPKL
jgi:long-chain fatty acid transport protein